MSRVPIGDRGKDRLLWMTITTIRLSTQQLKELADVMAKNPEFVEAVASRVRGIFGEEMDQIKQRLGTVERQLDAVIAVAKILPVTLEGHFKAQDAKLDAQGAKLDAILKALNISGTTN